MEKELLTVTAGLAAQGYLIELLLMNIAHQQSDPLGLIEKMRFQLETQLHSDVSRLGEVFPGIGATQALCDATKGCLNMALDRVAGQFENQPPPKYHA